MSVKSQRLIGDNANMKGAMVPGSVRNGGGLLVRKTSAYAAVIADASSRCSTTAYVAWPGISATEHRSTTEPETSASRLATCALTRPSRPRCCMQSHRWPSRQRLLPYYRRARTRQRHENRIDQLEKPVLLSRLRYEAARRAGASDDKVEPENRIVPPPEPSGRWNERLAGGGEI